MDIFEVQKVALAPVNKKLIHGRHLDAPKPELKCDTYEMEVSGWIIGRDSPAISIEIVHQGDVLWRAPINQQRADVANHFAEVPHAAQSGFRIIVSTLRLTSEFEFKVHGVLRGNARVLIGTVKGRRLGKTSNFQPTLSPLLLNSLGRSGSTWAMLLLAQHPSIVSYRPIGFEPRIVSYWIEVLKTLSNPASYLQSLAPESGDANWWLGDKPPINWRPSPDKSIREWMGREYIENLVDDCKKRIDDFYTRVAEGQDRKGAKFFAEKVVPHGDITKVVRDLYRSSREVILVRDFRDMVCSIFAFNAKRGYVGFGRESVKSDQEYVKRLRTAAASLLRCWKTRRNRTQILRYEDLILRPESTLKEVLDYLQIDSDTKTCRQMLQQAKNTNPSAQKHHRTSSDPVASIGRWRHELNPPLRQICEESFNEILSEFGYDI